MKNAARFESRYTKIPFSTCWEWLGRLNLDGYGEFDVDNKTVRAHRYSYTLYKGEIPAGMCVCHSCDNPSCVNPEHLWLGTQLENIKDRHQKGRTRWKARPGVSHNMVKLTEAQVQIIQQDTRKLKDISREYGISEAQVSRIRNKKSWFHL